MFLDDLGMTQLREHLGGLMLFGFTMWGFFWGFIAGRKK